MNEYERLTKQDNFDDFCENVSCPHKYIEEIGCSVQDCDNCYYNKIYTRLAEIEDKIESGRLVELPCKVGDTVYYIEYFCRSKGCSSTEQMYCCGCPEMLERERKKETYVICEKKFKLEYLSNVNKTIYLTKAEAEARLKELEETENEEML